MKGKNNWLRVFQNVVATFLAFDRSRSHNVINKNFAGEEQGNMVWLYLPHSSYRPSYQKRLRKGIEAGQNQIEISGCFPSDEGGENYATVASVIQTAVKNGQNPFEVLRVIMTLAQI